MAYIICVAVLFVYVRIINHSHQKSTKTDSTEKNRSLDFAKSKIVPHKNNKLWKYCGGVECSFFFNLLHFLVLFAAFLSIVIRTREMSPHNYDWRKRKWQTNDEKKRQSVNAFRKLYEYIGASHSHANSKHNAHL